LGSILAAIAVPAGSWFQGNPLPLNIVASALGAFVIFRHRENIKRLLNGTENRFVKKAAVPRVSEKPGG
jgi:glycerol-3-phosphate acyltransferase PlsY